ncbi:MAG: HAMP domain-containing protein [Desulfobacteraceae bacterium]|nr:HAMP domain-containing protein [Desulfobacteraceae bacterium]
MIRLQDIKMKKKLISLFLIIGLVPLLFIGGWSLYKAKKSLMDKSYEQLIAVREVKKSQISMYFKGHRQDMEVLAHTVRMLTQAAFDKLETVQELKKAQLEEFLNKVRSDIIALSKSSDVIKLYENLDKYQKDMLTDLDAPYDVSSTEYNEIYNEYGKYLLEYTEIYGYHDIFLICPHGHVMFTAAKEDDLGTNLEHGRYKDESLAHLWRNVLETKDIYIEDFSPYGPSNGQQAAFIGAPIYDKSKNILGVVALQIPADPTDRIVQRREGMGKTGETYVVGKKNGKTSFRSNMKTMGEGKYVIGYDINTISTSYIEAALAGKGGQEIHTDSAGKLVLTSFDPLDIKGLNWACISKIDMEEAVAWKKHENEDDFFNAFIKTYGYHDLFLIHPEGKIFYTVRRESDYGTDIIKGKYKDSGLGKLVRKTMKAEKFSIEDFSPYAPSKNEPSAFIAQPLIYKGEIHMVIALQLSIESVNSIMQQREGMGETGETYLVGHDKRMRSDSYLDNQGHSVRKSFSGSIEKNGVDTDASGDALSGKTGIKIVNDYLNNPVLSAYTPVKIEGLKWALLAEIDKKEVMRPIKNLIYFIGIAVIGMTVVTILTAIYTGTRISEPLAKSVRFAKNVAQGDLRTNLKVSQKDEAGMLANALRDMAAKLRVIIKEVTDTANTVSASSEELSSVSTQLASSAEELNAQSETVAAGSEQVSASVSTVASAAEQSSASVSNIAAMTEEMAATIANVSDAVKKTADDSKEVADASEDMSSRAGSIASAIEEMTASLNETACNTVKASRISQKTIQRTEEVNNRLEGLISASKQIGKVIGLIKDIADQTNMLALNATIEAAGAGEVGKGFAVVAGEVKELAKQSADATGEIAEQIEQIQKSTDDVVAAVGEISSVINESAGINGTIASSVEQQTAAASEISKNVAINARFVRQIAGVAEQSSERMGEVNLAAHEISKTATEVAKHVDELSRGVKDVAMSASEAARGVEEISKNMQGIGIAAKETASGAAQINVSSAELAGMAAVLSQIVSRFNV